MSTRPCILQIKVEVLRDACASGRIVQGSHAEQRLLQLEMLKFELLEMEEEARRAGMNENEKRPHKKAG